MQRTRIKICGLTRAEDAAAAVSAGADAIGLVFAPSSRRVSLDQAAEVAGAVPPPVARIGVFVDADAEFVAQAVRAAGLTAVQFHGTETPELCSAAPVPVIKALSVSDAFDWSLAEAYRGNVAALLLDTYVAGQAGGTAKTFAWDRALGAPAWAPVFVAGGLRPENAADCIRVARPYAVDVSSGVESAPGLKDARKIEEFCAAVRAADEEALR